MSTTKTITHQVPKDAKREGMTLADLSQFLDEAQRAGITNTAHVAVTTGFRSQIIKLEVTG